MPTPPLAIVAPWIIPGLWLLWAGYWAWAARGVKPATRSESRASRLARALPLLLAYLLLFAPTIPGWLGAAWAHGSWTLFATGVAVVAAGLSLTVWARATLGGNWSGMVTIKAQHEIIRTGPYRWVRHPIYTGILVAVLGCAVSRPEWRGIVALASVAIIYWQKLRLEERWLGETFGAAYADYRRTTWALIPYVL